MPCQLSKQELAEIFGVKLRQVDNYIRAGMPRDASVRPHLYTAESIKWIIAEQYRAKRGPEPSMNGKLGHRLQELKVEEAELDLARKKGEVVHREDVAEFVHEFLLRLARAVKTLPRHAGRLLGLKKQTEFREVLTELSNEVLEELQRESLEYTAGERSSRVRGPRRRRRPAR